MVGVAAAGTASDERTVVARSEDTAMTSPCEHAAQVSILYMTAGAEAGAHLSTERMAELHCAARGQLAVLYPLYPR